MGNRSARTDGVDARRVISVSRRTDIPAWYTRWLIKRLEEGRARYFHPFERVWKEVSLLPQDVVAIVFWTRDLRPLLPYLPSIAERYKFYFLFTATGMGLPIELNPVPTHQTVEQIQQVATAFGPERIHWRFDPVLLAQQTGPEETTARFQRLCEQLEGATHRCYTSFFYPYPFALRRLEQAGVRLLHLSPPEQQDLAVELDRIARKHGMRLLSCCTPEMVAAGVERGRCVDPEALEAVGAVLPSNYRPAPSRKHCGCYASADIGAYDTCVRGCLYCYATHSTTRAQHAYNQHLEEHPSLLPER